MKDSLIWGLGIGLVISLFVILLLATGPGHSDLLYNADLLLLPIGVVFLHRFQKRRRGMTLSYGRAFAGGAMATLVTASLSRSAYFIYLEFVDDSLFGEIARQWRSHLSAEGLDSAAIDERLAAMSFSAWNFSFQNWLSFMVVGIVLIAATSIFTRGESALTDGSSNKVSTESQNAVYSSKRG